MFKSTSNLLITMIDTVSAFFTGIKFRYNVNEIVWMLKSKNSYLVEEYLQTCALFSSIGSQFTVHFHYLVMINVISDVTDGERERGDWGGYSLKSVAHDMYFVDCLLLPELWFDDIFVTGYYIYQFKFPFSTKPLISLTNIGPISIFIWISN